MSKVSDILATNTHFSVRYIRQHLDKVSTSPYHPFNDTASSLTNSRNAPNSALPSQYLREDTNFSLKSVNNERSQNLQTPSQIGVNVDELPEIPSATDTGKELPSTAGSTIPTCLKGIMILGISFLSVAIIATAIATPIIILSNQLAANETTTSTTFAAALSTMTTTSSTSATTQTTTSASTTSATTSTTTTRTTSTTSTTTSTRTTSTTSTSTSTSTSTTSTSTSATTSTTSSSTSTTTTTPSSCSGWMWNATGVTVAGITGSSGTAANQFNLPWNIYLDSNKTLYVADNSNSRIQKWLYGATSGTTIAGTTTNGSASNRLYNPRTVWVDDSNVYVADSGNYRVQMFVNGSTTGVTVASNRLGIVMWVEIDNYNNIYTTDMSNNTIWKNQSVFASGSGLNGPQGTAVMSNGSILITNTQSHTVLMWHPGQSSGTIVAGVNGSPGSSSTQFIYPTSVAVDYNGNFWVVDNNNHRVQFFCRTASNTTAGRTVAGGSSGTGSTQLYYPVGLALDSSLNLYVADTSNHRIQRYQKIA